MRSSVEIFRKHGKRSSVIKGGGRTDQLTVYTLAKKDSDSWQCLKRRQVEAIVVYFKAHCWHSIAQTEEDRRKEVRAWFENSKNVNSEEESIAIDTHYIQNVTE
jgi:hypothetical protein